jgi:membrane-associated phospholipid phosphatase
MRKPSIKNTLLSSDKQLQRCVKEQIKAYFWNMYRSLLLLFIFLMGNFQADIYAQSENSYEYKRPLDISIGIITIGAGTAAMILQKKKQPLTEADLSGLSLDKINRFDRSAARRSWNERIHLASDIGMVFSMATPAFLLIDPKMRSQANVIIPMWMETAALTFALTGITKESVQRARPYTYNPDAPLENKLKKDATSSFFSGHSSMSAANAFFTAKVFSDLNPNSRWKPAVWTGAAVLPLTVALLRYGGGKHFFTDIIAGYAVGAAIGILVPQLHKINSRH